MYRPVGKYGPGQGEVTLLAGATTARPALLMTGPPYQQPHHQQQQVLGRPRPKPDGRSTQYEWRS